MNEGIEIENGCYLMTFDGLIRLGGLLPIAKLPKGDWLIRQYRDTIIVTDRSGKNPPWQVDKDGNWTQLNPTEVSNADAGQ
jgi:hypothetical protein